jgi:hypothetical protein
VSKDKAALLRHISSTNIFANTPLLQPVPLNVSSPALDPRTIDGLLYLVWSGRCGVA